MEHLESKCNLTKTTTITILILLAITFISPLILPHVKAVDVEITSISPETHQGKIGEEVRIIGTINKTDGLYRIWFDNRIVNETYAIGNNVNVTFLVPPLPKGNYTITLQDTDKNINATSWFYVETAYNIEAKKPTPPEQLQENSTVEISVNVAGGEQNTIYLANITVKAPSPSNETNWMLITLTNTTDTGTANATVVYPNDFLRAHTNYTGTYAVSFNETLDIDTFFIGLTDRTEYHRFQQVNIKAAGYTPSENVTVTILFGAEIVYLEDNVTADEGGIIQANWVVPSNASMGTYAVNITSTSIPPTRKNPPDFQYFTVPGFDVNITTRNLAEESVMNVTIQVFEDGGFVTNVTSGLDGLVSLKIDVGNYTCHAYYKEQKVGELLLEINGTASFNLDCNLTNLRILVMAFKDGIEIRIPEIKIYLASQPENQTLTTDIDGTAIMHSLLPNVTYLLNSTRYGTLFNVTTIPSLLVNETTIAWFNVTIICPTFTLKVNVTNPNAGNQPINNATVKIQEFMGGLYYEARTVDGVATSNCVLGNYSVEVYMNGLRLNGTIVNLNETIVNVSLSCKLYSLNVSFRVADYFGQPIPNAVVTLLQDGLQSSSQTRPDGIAEFLNIIGGKLRVRVYLSGSSQPQLDTTSYVDNSATIQIKIEKYVVLAGFLIETSQLTTAIIIVVTVILILSLEVYRRKRVAPKKSSS